MPNTCSSTASPAGVASLRFECPGAVVVYTGAALLVVINQNPEEPTQLLPPSLGCSAKIKTIEMFQKLKKKKICHIQKCFSGQFKTLSDFTDPYWSKLFVLKNK